MIFNKKGQVRSEKAIFLYLFIFCVGIILLYILSKFLFVIGFLLIFGGIIALILGAHESEDQIVFIGIILITIGLISLMMGIAGINFFEKNEFGSNLLKTSGEVIEASAETYETLQEVGNVVQETQLDAISKVNQEIGNLP